MARIRRSVRGLLRVVRHLRERTTPSSAAHNATAVTTQPYTLEQAVGLLKPFDNCLVDNRTDPTISLKTEQIRKFW